MFNEGDKVRFIDEYSFDHYGIGVVVGYTLFNPMVKWSGWRVTYEAVESLIRKLTPLELALL